MKSMTVLIWCKNCEADREHRRYEHSLQANGSRLFVCSCCGCQTWRRDS